METILKTILIFFGICLIFFMTGIFSWLTYQEIKSKNIFKDKFFMVYLPLMSIVLIFLCVYVGMLTIRQYF